MKNDVVALRMTAKWIAENKQNGLISVVATETGGERIVKDKAGIFDKRKNMGEQTIFEAISNEYIMYSSSRTRKCYAKARA